MQKEYQNGIKRRYTVAFLMRLAVMAVSASLMLGVMAVSAEAAKYAGIVVDAKSGKVLYGEDADSLRYPASLTKMMTLYLVFEALESGRISLKDKVTFSPHASREPPSKLGVRAGNAITVEEGILALVTRSANDAATALGEFIGGSEDRFAAMMTAKARSLGMKNTVYRNANGLPNSEQVTTARDQARLGVALRQHFPQYYGYFSTRSFKFGRQTIGNHNRLLGQVKGVDGIKTGFTNAAGYNLVTSVVAEGRSVVGVVLGGSSGGQRDAKMRELVKRYLPAATTTPTESLIAKFPSAPTRVARADQPDTAGQLASRGGRPAGQAADMTEAPALTSAELAARLPAKSEQQRMRSAGVNPNEIAAAYAPKSGQDAAEAIRALTSQTAKPAKGKAGKPAEAADLAIATSRAAVPAAKPGAKAKAGDAENDEDGEDDDTEVDAIVTASTASRSGWYIQVGVSSDRDEAMALLRDAREKGGKVLRTATPFTVAYSGGDGKLFRARFSGFDDQKTATNACQSLKKKGIACWATSQ